MAVCHEWNTIAHLSDYEGNPEARPFTREELQRFLDYADEQAERAVRPGRKGRAGGLPGCDDLQGDLRVGLRRTERSRPEVADFGRNPRAPQFGRHGTLNVRYGKAKRGSRRGGGTCCRWAGRWNVLSVMGWAVEAVADYAENVRLRLGFTHHPALWVTERAGGSSRRRSMPGSPPAGTRWACPGR